MISDYVDNKLINRCYSICEDPISGKLSVGIKRVPQGKLSNHILDNAQKGNTLKVSGPYGNFVLPDDRNIPIVLIAGGSGITPIISILKSYLRTSKQTVTLLYGCQSKEDIIFEKELAELSASYKDQLNYMLTFDILDEHRQYQYLYRRHSGNGGWLRQRNWWHYHR